MEGTQKATRTEDGNISNPTTADSTPVEEDATDKVVVSRQASNSVTENNFTKEDSMFENFRKALKEQSGIEVSVDELRESVADYVRKKYSLLEPETGMSVEEKESILCEIYNVKLHVVEETENIAFVEENGDCNLKENGWVECRELPNNVRERLIEFVKCFVQYYEHALLGYLDRLENQKSKAGKWARLTGDMTATMAGGSEGTEISGIKASFLVGTKMFQKAIMAFSIQRNRNHIKQIVKQLYMYKHDPVNMKREVLIAAVQTFYCYESQFIQVNCNKSWEIAMIKLAHDAVNRSLNYFRKNADEEFSCETITKGIVYGESKKYSSIATGIPHLTSGHTVYTENQKWNTGKFFRCPKLSKDVKNRVSEYGFRRLFDWELQLDGNVSDVELPIAEDLYILKSKQMNKIVDAVSQEIENDTPMNLDRKKYFDKCMEQIKVDVFKCGNELKQFIESNLTLLLEYMRKNPDDILEWHKEIQENDRKEQIRHDILINKLQKTENKIIEIYDATVDTVPTRFGLKNGLVNFTGRDTQLKEIHNSLKDHIVIVHGLPGVGKSELAIWYANKHYKGDNIIWINATTWETAKESFLSLYKEKQTDEDEVEKNMDIIIKTIASKYKNKNTLFIFDNADNISLVEEFMQLTQGSKIQILITSLRSHTSLRLSIKCIQLSCFEENEAFRFVKDTLNNIDDSQKESIERLVKQLSGFPLALEQAVAYINDQNENFKYKKGYKINDYVNEYVIAERLLDDKVKEKNTKTSAALELAFHKIRNKPHGEIAMEVLNIMAYLASDNITTDLFSSIVSDNDILSEVMKLLKQYSIIHGDKVYQMHGLVQQVIRLKLDEETVLRNTLKMFEREKLNRFSSHAYSSHIISIWNHAQKYEALIKTFIVDDRAFLHALAEYSEYNIINEIIKVIENKFPTHLKGVINHCDASNGTPLHGAAVNNNYKTVQLLINKGADVSVQKKTGWTALSLAAKNGHLKCVEEILKRDSAPVDAVTGYGFTALHLAVQKGYTKVVHALIKNGANVNIKAKLDYTPLHFAVKENYPDIVELLLNADCMLNVLESEYKHAPLHLAARNGLVDVTKILLKKEIDVNIRDKHNFTPLHHAVKHSLDVVNILLEQKKTDINALTDYLQTPLHLAVKWGKTKIVRTLLEKGADVNIADGEKITPLHSALFKNRDGEILNSILSHPKVNVNAQTSQGNTPLHLAAEKGILEAAKALIANNADVSIRNEKGKLPFEMIQEENQDLLTYVNQLEKSTELKLVKNLSDMAFSLKEQKEYKTAKVLLERCVRLKEQIFGYEHVETARTLTDLACIYGCCGERNQQEHYLNEALRIQNEIHCNFIETARTLTNLGYMYEAMEDSDKKNRFFMGATTLVTMEFSSVSNEKENALKNYIFFLERMITFLEKHEEDYFILTGNIYLEVAKIHRKLGEFEKEKICLEKGTLVFQKDEYRKRQRPSVFRFLFTFGFIIFVIFWYLIK